MSKRRTSKKKSSGVFGIRWIVVVQFLVVLTIGLGLLMIAKNKIDPSQSCANSISCIKDLSGKYESGQTQGEFMGQVVQSPTLAINPLSPTKVLGQGTGPKKIYVDLAAQRLYAFEGDVLVYSFPVSTGKWGATPTGTFTIWVKLPYTRMSGGNPAIGTYYNLPNVPNVMFYHNSEVSKAQGYSIHGAYWHNNFGHPMSHGCVNMALDDVKLIYAWADPVTDGKSTVYSSEDNPGTQIIVYGVAPNE